MMESGRDKPITSYTKTLTCSHTLIYRLAFSVVPYPAAAIKHHHFLSSYIMVSLACPFLYSHLLQHGQSVNTHHISAMQQLFYSFFKKLVGKEVAVELKNDVELTGKLHSVDQYLNVKLEDVQVVKKECYPQLVSLYINAKGAHGA